MADRKLRIPVIRNRLFSYIFSGLLVVTSVVLLLIVGFNLGIDFESGLSQTVQLAPSGLSVSYKGSASAVLKADSAGFTLEKRDAEGVSKVSFPFSEYPTSGALADALQTIDGVECKVFDSNLSSSGVITGFGFPVTLRVAPFVINFADSSKSIVSIEQVRSSISDFKDAKVQSVGNEIDQVYQIRAKVSDSESSKSLEEGIIQALKGAFGSDTVVVLESNFIGAKYSSSLLSSALIAVAVAVALILIYVWLRFELGYAVCSIVALLHDVICMLGFIIAMGFEVSSTTIAAVLTIIGYSLNNTIVIMDRIRSLIRSDSKMELDWIIDESVTASLSRTTISSVTTMLAIIPLCIFASGDIFYFATSLLFGIVIGTYSSNLIAPALLYSFSGIDLLDARKLKNPRKAMTDQDSAAYLLEETVAKANAAKMEKRAERAKLKGSTADESASSGKQRSDLKLEK